MTDVVSSETRSKMMSGIQGKNTKPELLIRKKLHSLGYRYRIHVSNLPGKPDIVLPKYKSVIFVNGCFWHGHNCHLFKWPSTRTDFWQNKITRTKEKDIENKDALFLTGWHILEVWECALKGKTKLSVDIVIKKIEGWLQSDIRFMEIHGEEKE